MKVSFVIGILVVAPVSLVNVNWLRFGISGPNSDDKVDFNTHG